MKSCKASSFHNNNPGRADHPTDEHGTERIPVRQIDGGDGGGGGDPEGERSRPPTPFSRPLTARNVAQRPRTTTIFERESDAKRAGGRSF